MKVWKLPAVAILAACLLCALSTVAITLFEVTIECPVCKTSNQFLDYGSWGSYVYQWPSKFQMFFWPYTDNVSLYTCKKCHLTLFMWDFKDLPKDKIADVRSSWAGINLPSPTKTYTDVPMSDRLPVAEKLYKVLGRDRDFWSLFYRVEGYHFEHEKHPDQAAAARTQSLEITRELLADPRNEGRRKELLLTSAAMHHFLNDDAQALNELETASKLTFVDEKPGAEKSKNYDTYLTALIGEYAKAIQAGNVPKGSL
jgi:hypothetical protein